MLFQKKIIIIAYIYLSVFREFCPNDISFDLRFVRRLSNSVVKMCVIIFYFPSHLGKVVHDRVNRLPCHVKNLAPNLYNLQRVYKEFQFLFDFHSDNYKHSLTARLISTLFMSTNVEEK